MTFLVPHALWGLALLPLLVLLERWRRRPRPLAWPSLVIWRAATASEAPARRRLEPLLLYECAAVLLLCLAASEPALDTGREARSVVIVLDTGPHMDARRRDGTTAREATLAEVRRIEAALDSGDMVTRFETDDVLGSFPDADLEVIATSRAGADGPGRVVVGRAPDGFNVGIDAVHVKGDELWFALATDGEARTVRVRVGSRVLEVRTGVGTTTEFAPLIEVLDRDNYDRDNRYEVQRPGLVVRDETGSRFVKAALAAGTPVVAGDVPHLVLTRSGGAGVDDPVRGSECEVAPGLFDGLFLGECVWRGVKSVEPVDGDGLLLHRGRALARWRDETTLWIGLPLDREWDDHGTLAVLIERSKQARMPKPPDPPYVATRGVDRPWDGVLPGARRKLMGRTFLRAALGLLAALVVALYLRAIVRA